MPVTKVSSVSYPTRLFRHDKKVGPAGPAPYDNYAIDVQIATAVRTRTGERKPKWRKVIRDGGNATTALSAVYDSFYSTPVTASLEATFTDGISKHYRDMNGDLCFATSGANAGIPTFVTPGISAGKADNRARARFYKRLREVHVQFSGPTFLGEFREALRMIKRPAAALRDSMDRYAADLKKHKKGHPKQWKSRDEIRQIAGGLWLEHTFGWKPLLNDVQSAVQAYERLTPPVATRKIISVGDSDSVDRRPGLAALTLWQTGAGTWTNGTFRLKKDLHQARESATVRYKGAIMLKHETTHWDNLALFGFTPSEFIPTAWELLPWSFLIDYFTNIGDVITAGVTDSSSVAFAQSTTRMLCTVTGAVTPDLNATVSAIGAGWSKTTGHTNSASYFLQRKTLSRQPIGTVPLPVFSFESGLSVGQMCNMTALLATVNNGLHRQNPPRRNWRR